MTEPPINIDDFAPEKEITKKEFVERLKRLPEKIKAKPDDIDILAESIRSLNKVSELGDLDKNELIPLHALFSETGILQAKTDDDIDEIIALLKKSSSL